MQSFLLSLFNPQNSKARCHPDLWSRSLTWSTARIKSWHSTFQDFGGVFTPISPISRTPTTLDLRHASLQMGGPDSFGTPPSYHKTLSVDLGLIHIVHRGFAYRDFATGEDEGSCPWVSRLPKRWNLFTLNWFGVSHIEISRLAKTRGLALGFTGCQNTETWENYSFLYKVSRLQSHDPSDGSWVIIPRLDDLTEKPSWFAKLWTLW